MKEDIFLEHRGVLGLMMPSQQKNSGLPIFLWLMDVLEMRKLLQGVKTEILVSGVGKLDIWNWKEYT